jgi:uroporphyrinogen-III synthase
MTLEGKTVLVTRRPEQAGPLVEGLRRRGAVPLLAPMIRILEPESWEECDRALGRLGTYTGLAFASANAAERFLQRAFERGHGPHAFDGKTILAVGAATRRALDGLGLSVTLTPAAFSAAALVEALKGEDLSGTRFLLPRGDRGRRELAEGLCELGAAVDEAEVYRTVRPEEADVAKLRDSLRQGRVDMITFASPSAAHHFAEEVALPELDAPVRRTPIAVIGPTTAAAVRSLGWEPAVTPAQSTAEGLIAAIEAYFESATAG